jgi:hypothetical protein
MRPWLGLAAAKAAPYIRKVDIWVEPSNAVAAQVKSQVEVTEEA